MKKINFFAILVIIVAISIFVFQNRSFFFSTESIVVNLGIVQYRTPEIHVGLFFFVCFFTGFIVSYFLNLTVRFNSQKTIKNLNDIISLQRKKIETFEKKNQGIAGDSGKRG